MTNVELMNLGEAYLSKAGARGTRAQTIAVGDLVRLCLDMKNALEDIRAKATFELKDREAGVPAPEAHRTIADIKKRAEEALK